MILQEGSEAVVVIEDTGHTVGYIQQEDLIQAFTDLEYETCSAEAIMRVDIPEIPADIPIRAAVKIMLDEKVRVLFVNHHAAGRKYPTGMLTYQNILLYMAHQNLEEIGIQAKRKSPLQMFYERREAARKRNNRSSF